MRAGLLVSATCFLALNGTVLLGQWISGDTSLQFMLGTAAIIAGSSAGLFSVIATLGLTVSAPFEDERATKLTSH